MEKDFSLELTSKDECKVSMPKSYKLCRTETQKESKLAESFKKSIFGMDIGIHSEGFSYIAILATMLAVGVLSIMFLYLRVE